MTWALRLIHLPNSTREAGDVKPHDPGQGSASRYGQGCRCSGCRAAHKDRILFYQWRRRNLPKISRRLAEIEAEMEGRAE